MTWSYQYSTNQTFRERVTGRIHGMLRVFSCRKCEILHEEEGWEPITASSPRPCGHNNFTCNSSTWKHELRKGVRAHTHHYIEIPLFRRFSYWLAASSFQRIYYRGVLIFLRLLQVHLISQVFLLSNNFTIALPSITPLKASLPHDLSWLYVAISSRERQCKEST